MKDNNKVLYIIIFVCVVLVIGLCVFLIVNYDKEEITDAQRFKRDFEQYNGLTYEDTGDLVIDVSIPEDNPFIYKTGKEILEILESEDAYVLFGYSACPLTRAAIETLIEVLQDQNIATVYYVDIKDIRDEYTYSGNIIPDRTKEGTEAYYNLLEFFKGYLSTYYISDESGFYLFDTGVTRLNSPTFAVVSNGKIIGFHEELVESYDYTNRELTDEEKEELKELYLTVILGEA